MLGVCLGHQAIGEAFGARLTNLSEVYHGVQTPCFLTGEDYIFRGLPRQFPVGRYHSWVVAAEGLPACLEVTATSPDGHIMALRHRDYDLHGIQFHPESVLTPDGRIIVENFLRHAPEKICLVRLSAAMKRRPSCRPETARRLRAFRAAGLRKSGKAPCGVPDCTLRRVLEYLPQSTLAHSARHGGASGKAGLARALCH